MKNNQNRKNIKATVVIPTYNGEKYIAGILKALKKQVIEGAFEVLVIDSGSTDKTLSLVRTAQKKTDNIRIHEISNSEFGHGKTRNLAAQLANGEYIAYLTHDAIPSHKRWLYEIIKPFEINEKIVGVTGKQIPRPQCVPLLKYEIQSVFRSMGPDYGTTIFYKDDFVKNQAAYDAVSFYSDANSAARRDYLLGDFPYQDVQYAEDQLFGRDVIDAGYYKVYAARASVEHSNDLTLKEYKHRLFDETLGLRKIGIPVAVPSKKSVLKMTITGILKDTIRTVLDPQYSVKRKVYWLVINPFYHIEKWRGVRKAALADLADTKLIETYSLEKRNKK